MAARARVVEARTIRTRATGFAGTGVYTHTLNPYGGCRYCYMRTFPVQRYRGEQSRGEPGST